MALPCNWSGSTPHSLLVFSVTLSSTFTHSFSAHTLVSRPMCGHYIHIRIQNPFKHLIFSILGIWQSSEYDSDHSQHATKKWINCWSLLSPKLPFFGRTYHRGPLQPKPGIVTNLQEPFLIKIYNKSSELALGFLRWEIGAFPVCYRRDNSSDFFTYWIPKR